MYPVLHYRNSNSRRCRQGALAWVYSGLADALIMLGVRYGLPQSLELAGRVMQPYVDNGLSRTLTIHADCDMAEYQSLFERAYRMGLKGCSAFRPNPVTGSVLSAEDGGRAQHHNAVTSIARPTDDGVTLAASNMF